MNKRGANKQHPRDQETDLTNREVVFEGAQNAPSAECRALLAACNSALEDTEEDEASQSWTWSTYLRERRGPNSLISSPPAKRKQNDIQSTLGEGGVRRSIYIVWSSTRESGTDANARYCPRPARTSFVRGGDVNVQHESGVPLRIALLDPDGLAETLQAECHNYRRSNCLHTY